LQVALQLMLRGADDLKRAAASHLICLHIQHVAALNPLHACLLLCLQVALQVMLRGQCTFSTSK
jgi:hypothetical protein